jgi:hypothetical protein
MVTHLSVNCSTHKVGACCAEKCRKSLSYQSASSPSGHSVCLASIFLKRHNIISYPHSWLVRESRPLPWNWLATALKRHRSLMIRSWDRRALIWLASSVSTSMLILQSSSSSTTSDRTTERLIAESFRVWISCSLDSSVD